MSDEPRLVDPKPFKVLPPWEEVDVYVQEQPGGWSWRAYPFYSKPSSYNLITESEALLADMEDARSDACRVLGWPANPRLVINWRQPGEID